MKAAAVERLMPAQQWISIGASRVQDRKKADHLLGIGGVSAACGRPCCCTMSWKKSLRWRSGIHALRRLVRRLGGKKGHHMAHAMLVDELLHLAEGTDDDHGYCASFWNSLR